MWQARRWPVKKRMSSRSNSSPPSSTAMLTRVVASTKPVFACGLTVSQPAPTQYRDPPAGSAVLRVLEVRAAVRRAAGCETVRAMRG